MKILLYYEATTFAESMNETGSLNLIRDHLYNWCGKSLLTNSQCDIKFIVSEATYYKNKEKNIIDEKNMIVITDDDIIETFNHGQTFKETYLKIFHNELTQEEVNNYNNLIRKKLGTWVPDLIVTFPIQNDYLKKLYPNALVLNNENGIFSRPPFMRTLRYEPFNYTKNFTNIYKQEIQNYKITKRQEQKVRNFKNSLIEIIEKNNPYKSLLENLRKKYKYLILLPIITDNGYRESDSNDEFVYLNNFLRNIPKEIGVIITRHDEINSILNKKVMAYLKVKYPNIIDVNFSEYITFGSSSMNFFHNVDAIVNCMTGTGLLSILWNTKVIAYDKNYSHWFSDYVGIDNIIEKLEAPKKNKNALLYWYFTHYAVFQKNFDKPDWYYNYFKTKLEKYRKEGITFDFYEQIEDFDEMAKYVLECVKDYYAPKPISLQYNEKIPLIHKIFSVKNENNHKVLRVLGLKLKFKCRKKSV